MRRRRPRFNHLAMGEGISFEDVLTVITVLLLLRVVFLVPMINLDKAKTVAAQTDQYWTRQAIHVLTQGTGAEIRPYRAAFGIRDSAALVTRVDGATYVEVAAPDSSVLVIRHVPASQSFIAMRVRKGGHARSFQRGRLLWSQAEQEWFIGADTVDYGSHPASVAMEEEFRQWTLERRGY